VRAFVCVRTCWRLGVDTSDCHLSMCTCACTQLCPGQQVGGAFTATLCTDCSSVAGLSLTADETRMLVCDEENERVVVANVQDGRVLHTLQGQSGTLPGPAHALVVPASGQVLVVDHERCRVVVFAGLNDDTVVRTLADGPGPGPRQLRSPWGLTVLDGSVTEAAAPDGPVAVVADTHNHRLVMYRVRNDTVVRHVGSRGAAPGQFVAPQAVCAVAAGAVGNPDTWLAVADGGNRRVQVLTRTGMCVRVLSTGAMELKLGVNLVGVALCGGTGEMLVVDRDHRRVVAWRLTDGGECRVVCGGAKAGKAAKGSKGAKGGETGKGSKLALAADLQEPWGVIVSGEGDTMWVADSGSARLCVFH
jgi:DNA-binding beta-propeller fold protein YncE